MNKNNKLQGKWIILDNNNNIIYHSLDLINIVNKARQYPRDQITIQKYHSKGTCIFNTFNQNLNHK